MQLYLNLIAILLLSGIALLNDATTKQLPCGALYEVAGYICRYNVMDKAFFVFGNRVPAFASSAYGSCLYIVNVAVIA